jgi:hypothetical protein
MTSLATLRLAETPSGVCGKRQRQPTPRHRVGLAARLGTGLALLCGFVNAQQGTLKEAGKAGAAGAPALAWAVPALPYRVLVEIPPCDIGKRVSPTMPAAVELDFASAAFTALKLDGPVDLDSIQVLRQDPASGQVLPSREWIFGRTAGERPSRFLDRSIPWDFPSGVMGGSTYPRCGYLSNARGTGQAGRLVFDHTQDGNAASLYAVYFGTRPAGTIQKIPRQGFIGDGLPRREAAVQYSLTGMVYNNVTIDDWDGDGLTDLVIGTGNGNLLLFRNEGDAQRPKFSFAEYLFDAAGKPLTVPTALATPLIVDWNADGKKDLLLSYEGGRLAWVENTGSNAARTFVWRGSVQADKQDIVTPHLPCPEAPHYTQDYAPGIEAVDWDNDGDLDLLLGGWTTGWIFYYENIGKAADGTPVLAARGPLQADGQPIDTCWGAHPCTVDLDGDGDLDLLSGTQGIGLGGSIKEMPGLVYYENIGTRSQPVLTQKPVVYEGSAYTASDAQPRPWDFNGDGRIDLVASDCSSVYLLQNVGTAKAPKFKAEMLQVPWGVAVPGGGMPTQLVDWNGDGFADVICSPQDSSNPTAQPSVSLNQGKGTQGVFAPPQQLQPKGQEIVHREPYGDPWMYVYVIDFDRDGVMDLLWADFTGNAYLHRNRGTVKEATFDTQGEKLMMTDGQPIKVGPAIVATDKIADFVVMQGSRASIAAADFNKDGTNDIVMGDAVGDAFYFANTGTHAAPRFAPGIHLGRLGERVKAFPYDGDEDGQLDVFVASEGCRLYWCRNLGAGANPQFAPAKEVSIPPAVPYALRSFVVADWDGDGEDDWLLKSSYPWFCWLNGLYIKYGYANGKILDVARKG